MRLAPACAQADKIAKELATSTDVNDTITQVGGTLRSFGESLLVGTKELVEQVRLRGMHHACHGSS